MAYVNPVCIIPSPAYCGMPELDDRTLRCEMLKSTQANQLEGINQEGIAAKLKLFKLIIAILSLAVVAAGVWLGLDLNRFAHQAGGPDDNPVAFTIAPGESFNNLTSRLQTAGIIRSPLRFKLLARFKGADKRLQAGEYRLSAVMTPTQVLDTLVNGKVFLYRMTVPEGYTTEQIADEAARLDLADAQTFKQLATSPEEVHALGFEANTLEGYLFPDTYYFPKHAGAQRIITKMTQRFHAQFSPKWLRRAQELHLSVHQVVTLASIIEKETGDPSERPIISSVFHNRLKKKMRLESDPTVIYGIANFDGNLKRRHLTTPTPYNTYIIKGLPPGPIANPGRLALEAALYPAQTDYLFFVAKKDGTHFFSTNIEEHNRAVRKYQLRHRKKSSRK